jgi:hypothetical protein
MGYVLYQCTPGFLYCLSDERYLIINCSEGCIFWDTTPCSPLKINLIFGEISPPFYWLKTKQGKKPESSRQLSFAVHNVPLNIYVYRLIFIEKYYTEFHLHKILNKICFQYFPLPLPLHVLFSFIPGIAQSV